MNRMFADIEIQFVYNTININSTSSLLDNLCLSLKKEKKTCQKGVRTIALLLYSIDLEFIFILIYTVGTFSGSRISIFFATQFERRRLLFVTQHTKRNGLLGI